jgi:hypothetical protein
VLNTLRLLFFGDFKMSHVDHPGDLVLLEAIARHTDVGYLGTVTPDGYPRAVPVNFAPGESGSISTAPRAAGNSTPSRPDKK